MVKKFWLFEALWTELNLNLNKTELGGGGDVEGVNLAGATTRTAARAHRVAD